MGVYDDDKGGDDNSKGMPAGGIHVEKSQVIHHSHTKDPEDILYMDVVNGEPDTGIALVGPRLGGEIGSVLGGHGDQPTDTSSSMLHSNALASAKDAQVASLLTHMQDS